MSGIVYVLSNAAMPGLVKIGKTDDILHRMNELYETGVPFPFTCELAIKVEDKDDVEKKLHDAFEDDRPNQEREFFQVDIEQVCDKLKELDIVYENVTKKATNNSGIIRNLEERASALEWAERVKAIRDELERRSRESQTRSR